MNILGINPGHNGSAALLIDGELEFYVEEERLSRSKYDGNPFMGILEGLKCGVDVLMLGGTSAEHPRLPWTGEDAYSALLRKHNPNVKVINVGHAHHLGHAASAFYNSGFKDAAAVILVHGKILKQMRKGIQTLGLKQRVFFPVTMKRVLNLYSSPLGETLIPNN